jgi:hypothetical protein
MFETYGLTLEDFAKEHAGNHRKFDSFCWSDRPSASENWALVYTSNRDGGCLAQSNESQINQALERFADDDSENPDVVFERHNHFACGYVDGFRIRVYRTYGKRKRRYVTQAFRELFALACQLSDYPVLDESDYSERDYEESRESWNNYARSEFVDKLESAFNDTDYQIEDLPSEWIDELWESVRDRMNYEYESTESEGARFNTDRAVELLCDDCETLYDLLALANSFPVSA